MRPQVPSMAMNWRVLVPSARSMRSCRRAEALVVEAGVEVADELVEEVMVEATDRLLPVLAHRLILRLARLQSCMVLS